MKSKSDGLMVSGFVLNVKNGSPISSVDINCDSSSCQTNTAGYYEFELPRSRNEFISFQYNKDEYVTHSLSIMNPDHDLQKIHLSTFLMPYEKIEIIRSSVGKTIQLEKGGFIRIPGMAEPEKDQKVSVAVAVFDVASDDILAVTGDFFGIDRVGTERILYSYGVLEKDMCILKTGKPYLPSRRNVLPSFIELPISGDPSIAPDDVPAWAFDTTSGKWAEQHTAVKTKNSYKFEMPVEVSLYNIDLNGPMANAKALISVTGRLVKKKTPVPGYIIYLSSITDNFFKRTVVTDKDGVFYFPKLPPIKQRLSLLALNEKGNISKQIIEVIPGTSPTIEVGDFELM